MNVHPVLLVLLPLIIAAVAFAFGKLHERIQWSQLITDRKLIPARELNDSGSNLHGLAAYLQEKTNAPAGTFVVRDIRR